jgi:GT2 family glycosyltransferase
MRLCVSAVVVNYGQRDLLCSCPESVGEAPLRVEDGHEIIVDNTSSDRPAEMVRAESPDVRLIELPAKAGLAGGVSVGIQHAKGERILCIRGRDEVARRSG